MFDAQQLRVQELAGMAPQAVAQLVRQLIERIDHQAREIDCKDAEIRFKQVRLEKITFELGRIWQAKRQFTDMDAARRLAAREAITKALWEELYVWLQLERTRVAEGGATAKALDYSLRHWAALTRT